MFKILKAVKALLENSTDVTDIVGTKVFPNVAPDKDATGRNISYPLVIMRRAGMSPTLGKDCRIAETTVEVTAYSTSYDQAIDLAEKIYEALNGFSGEAEGIVISKINFASADEAFVEVAYVQAIQFIVK